MCWIRFCFLFFCFYLLLQPLIIVHFQRHAISGVRLISSKFPIHVNVNGYLSLCVSRVKDWQSSSHPMATSIGSSTPMILTWISGRNGWILLFLLPLAVCLGIVIADFLPLSHPVPCIFCHFNRLHVLSHYIHKPPVFSCSFHFAWLLLIHYPMF